MKKLFTAIGIIGWGVTIAVAHKCGVPSEGLGVAIVGGIISLSSLKIADLI